MIGEKSGGKLTIADTKSELFRGETEEGGEGHDGYEAGDEDGSRSLVGEVHSPGDL